MIPGTSCLATIVLSLRDKNYSSFEAPRIILGVHPHPSFRQMSKLQGKARRRLLRRARAISSDCGPTSNRAVAPRAMGCDVVFLSLTAHMQEPAQNARGSHPRPELQGNRMVPLRILVPLIVACGLFMENLEMLRSSRRLCRRSRMTFIRARFN
jgi:hypothetical protein